MFKISTETIGFPIKMIMNIDKQWLLNVEKKFVTFRKMESKNWSTFCFKIQYYYFFNFNPNYFLVIMLFNFLY